jgi:hypothetical protein
MKPTHRIDTFVYSDEDFQPVVETVDWLVALMNWSPRFDLSAPRVVEAHSQTDEVFVLQRGKSMLFVSTEQGLDVMDMVPGVVYNVTRGTFHNVIGSRDAQWLIVESAYDPAYPTEYRELDADQCAYLQARFPAWLKG